MAIYCIGDSHANFFSGSDEMQPEWPGEGIKHFHPFFRAFRIGPVLAYNLCRNNSSTRGREKLMELLSLFPSKSKVMFCFGEIDCRAHIILQAERQKRPVEGVVRTVAERYFSVIKEVRGMGFTPLIWNVIPSAPTDINSKINVPAKYLFHGTREERNDVTRRFNADLKILAIDHDVFFLDFFDKLMNRDGSVKLEYYCQDDIHLAQKAMPIVLEALKKSPEFDKEFAPM